jgi:catechol 2,3-dioxygenase-like lactoylglutathione lyase family enzyme
MLRDHPVYPTIPTSDVARLRRFYEDVLGFTVQRETPSTVYLDAGGGTYLAVSRSAGQASGTHTQMAFRVPDIAAEVAELRARGVTFEEYETPKTVGGIADVGAGYAAWVKDPDGNLFGIWQFKDEG